MIDEDDKLTFFYSGNPEEEVFRLIEAALEEREHSLVEFYNEFLIDVYMLLDKRKSKHIAIDWDNTISADKQFFKDLITKLQEANFKPFVCTLRAPDRENIEEICEVLEDANIPIYLTDGKPKRKYMRSLGVRVHLWIDDFYPGICGDSCKILAKNNID